MAKITAHGDSEIARWKITLRTEHYTHRGSAVLTKKGRLMTRLDTDTYHVLATFKKPEALPFEERKEIAATFLDRRGYNPIETGIRR